MGSYLLIAIMALVRVAHAQTQADYCKISPENTMCLYLPYQYASTCPRIIPTTISAADKQLIVDVHNKFRSSVALGLETRGAPGPQPKASDMRALTWDDELALMADTHLRQCIEGHDKVRNVFGQNLAKFGSRPQNLAVNWTSAIESWFKEVRDFDAPQVSNFTGSSTSGPQIGHYTQVVWANTYKVGCSVINFLESNGYYRNRYGCNYGPAGNTPKYPVYQIGNPASACPSGTTANTNNGLCVY